MNYNKATLIGRLGKDPEVRYLNNGEATCSFSIATSAKFKDKSGAQQERTEWHRIVVYGKQAELCGQYLKRGSEAMVEGEIRHRKYQDKDGVERHVTEIRADSVQFGERAKGDQSHSDEPEPAPQPTPGVTDDLPF